MKTTDTLTTKINRLAQDLCIVDRNFLQWQSQLNNFSEQTQCHESILLEFLSKHFNAVNRAFVSLLRLTEIQASQRIGVIMRLQNLIPTETKLHLFKAAILPHLTYCHLVWHFCRASVTRRLERVHERGLRAVLKDKQSSYQQLLVKAKLPSLYNRKLQDICILMYKVKHNLCPRTYSTAQK